MPSRKITDAHEILQKQFAKAKADFEKEHKGVFVFLTTTYRSPDEQNELYSHSRTTPGPKVTNAKAGQSPHNYLPSFAIDVAFDVTQPDGKLKTDWSDKYFKTFSTYMTNPNIDWGGSWISFKDFPHFEVKGWKSLIKK